MLKCASNGTPHRSFCKRWLRGTAAAALGAASLAVAAQAFAQDAAKAKIPELSSADTAWLAFGVHWFDPPSGLRGPIR